MRYSRKTALPGTAVPSLRGAPTPTPSRVHSLYRTLRSKIQSNTATSTAPSGARSQSSSKGCALPNEPCPCAPPPPPPSGTSASGGILKSAKGAAAGTIAAELAIVAIDRLADALQDVDLSPQSLTSSWSVPAVSKHFALRKLTLASVGGIVGLNSLMAWCMSATGVNYVLIALGVVGLLCVAGWLLVAYQAQLLGAHGSSSTAAGWQDAAANLDKILKYVNCIVLLAVLLGFTCLATTQVLMDTLFSLRENSIPGLPGTIVSAMGDLTPQGRALFVASVLVYAYNIFVVGSLCYFARALILWILRTQLRPLVAAHTAGNPRSQRWVVQA